MVKLRQAIVVEGRYDKKTLENIVDAPIFETAGFGVFNDREKLAFLRQVAEKRGLIILTDSDGAGFVIRNYLKGALPKDGVLHAYIPDIAGKERRKARRGKAGLVGVEGMTRETILAALRRCGADFLEEGEAARPREPITKGDLYQLGLSGRANAAARRARLVTSLGLPRQLGAAALLDALNLLLTKQELYAAVQALEEPEA